VGNVRGTQSLFKLKWKLHVYEYTIETCMYQNKYKTLKDMDFINITIYTIFKKKHEIKIALSFT